MPPTIRSRARRSVLGLALILSMLSLTPSLPPTVPLATTGPAWGLAGGYSGVSMTDVYSRGVRVVMVEMQWRKAEPEPGVFNTSYMRSIRDVAAGYRSKGFKVILNYGMHHAPTWLLARSNARYVNQHGSKYTGSDEPNLIWNTSLRWYGVRYTRQVFSVLGTSFFAVRVGGGHWGELTYPATFRSDGRVTNSYWAFDGYARRSNPVPTWKPGRPSPNGEARRFLYWYLQALVRYQNWQISTVRKYYPGTIAVLYPSWGMRSGDFDKATSTNLAGTSSPEINGEVQRGLDHGRQIAAIADSRAAVWGTWAEKPGTISYLASRANKKGLRKFGENAGRDTRASMEYAVSAARQYGLTALIWIRAGDAYCNCNGWATISDYQDLIT